MNVREVRDALRVAAEWADWQYNSLEDFHAYALKFGCEPGGNIFDFVLADALKQRGLTWDQFHRAASLAGRAENDTAVRSELLEETVELLEHENNKLWRISQAVKLQNDPAQLQQFYDYVKGVVDSK